MAVITRQELQSTGKWWTWINHEGLNTFIVDTVTKITEAEAVVLKNKYLDDNLYNSVLKAEVSIYDNKQVIVDAVTFIKTTNPNLTQWNNYLSSLSWYDSLAVRWFLAVLAQRLAERNEVGLSAYTETEVLNKLKVWIIATPPRKLAKVLFGDG